MEVSQSGHPCKCLHLENWICKLSIQVQIVVLNRFDIDKHSNFMVHEYHQLKYKCWKDI